MQKYVIHRLFSLIPVLIGVSFLVFSLVHITPGDPVAIMMGLETANDAELEALRHELGLDRPFMVQYLSFVWDAARGDLGRSIQTTRPVVEMISQRLPATMELTAVAMFFALIIAIPIGVISAVKQYSLVDNASMFGALLGISMPSFWLGLVLILLFALKFGWFPASGRGGSLVAGLGVLITQFNVGPVLRALERLILPAFALGTHVAALITRLTRSSMLEVIRQEYIQTARAKGLSERMVIYRHALKNAMIPVVTIVGLYVGTLLGGSVITETIFAWPGVGRMAITAINQRDFPVVQAIVLVLATIFVFVNLLVDLVYGMLDPRIRYD
jgi:peptide/nickel transport system permease protein